MSGGKGYQYDARTKRVTGAGKREPGCGEVTAEESAEQIARAEKFLELAERLMDSFR
jgi:hypothetical protein